MPELDTDRAGDLILKLAEALVDDPRRVSMEASEMPRRINWQVKVDINDAGKLIGKHGSHLKAFGLVVRLMGEKGGEDWRLVHVPPDDGERMERAPSETPKHYDPTIASEILKESLELILEAAPVVSVDQHRNEFTFTVRPILAQDFARLLDAVEITPARFNPARNAETLNLASALGTLWRAYGRKEGVYFKVNVIAK